MSSPKTTTMILFSMVVMSLIMLSSTYVTAFSPSFPTMNQRSVHTTSLYLADETPESDSANVDAAAAAPAPAPPAANVKCPDCDLCDGSGRIAGGLGAVVTWLPIKAYRPCPNFVDRGGNYQRTGQPLDEIAFGRDQKYKN